MSESAVISVSDGVVLDRGVAVSRVSTWTRGAIACVAAMGVGGGAFAYGAATGGGTRAWGALVIGWLFGSSIAIGSVVLTAVWRLTYAKWQGDLVQVARQGAQLLLPSMAILLLVLAGAPFLAPWAHHVMPAKTWWLNSPFFIGRELLATSFLYWLARRFVAMSEDKSTDPTKLFRTAVVFAASYAVIVSMWSWDFVMAMDHEWVSTLIGPYIFMSALLSGVAMTAIRGVRMGVANEAQRWDIGKLVFGFCSFWAYLYWAQFLIIWYGNLPEEIEYLVRRMHAPWSGLAHVVPFLIWVLPFLTLFKSEAKKSGTVLTVGASIALFGLLVDKYVLIMPSLAGHDGPAFQIVDILVLLGTLAAFAFPFLRAGKVGPARAAH